MAYIVKQKSASGKIYVHLAENHHISELKQARQSRQHLGVLDADSGELLLSKAFKQLTPEIAALLAKAGITYHGRYAPEPGRQRKNSSPGALKKYDVPSAVEEIGEMHALLHLCRDLGLERSLSVFAKDGGALLTLAIWQVCTGEAQYLAESWLDTRVLPSGLAAKDFSSPSLSALMERIGGNQTLLDRFFKSWIAERAFPESVIYDTTSISSYSEQLAEVEWGYNRDKESLPQINLAMAMDGISGVPLAFRLLPGSIADVSTLLITGKFLAEYGLKSFAYSLDRGFYSSANLHELLLESLDFVIGVPFTNKQALKVVREALPRLQSSKGSLLYGDQVIRQTETTWEVSMKTKAEPDTPSRYLKAFVYFDQERATRQIVQRERKLLEFERLAAKQSFDNRQEAEIWRKENAKHLARFLQTLDHDGIPHIMRCEDRIDEANSTAGLSIYIAHHEKTPMTAERALAVARGRDAVEKVFDVFKNDNNQSRLRTGKSDVAQGRVFVAFLAAIVRTNLECRMREAQLNKTLSIDEVLAWLRKIRVVKFESGNRVLLEIPKKTRNLMEALKIPVPNIEKEAG